MKNKLLIGLIVFIFGCHSSDQHIDDSTTIDTSAIKKDSLVKKDNIIDETEIGDVNSLDENGFITKIFDFKTNKEWVFAGDKPAVIDFYADWCGPCKKLSPSIEALAKKYAGKIRVYKVNVDEQQAIAGAFGIQSIPTVLFCPLKGKPMASNGYVEEAELEKYISQILK